MKRMRKITLAIRSKLLGCVVLLYSNRIEIYPKQGETFVLEFLTCKP